jgi:hypothetical protein
VITVAWAASTLVTGLPCPLTRLQNSLREQGGQHALADTFMNTYLRGAFYPADHESLARLVVGLVIGVSWAGFAVRWHASRSSAARAPAGSFTDLGLLTGRFLSTPQGGTWLSTGGGCTFESGRSSLVALRACQRS